MSRGPGKIERGIVEALQREPESAFTTDDLCRMIYRHPKRPQKKHRVSVLRAMRSVIKRNQEYAIYEWWRLPGDRLAIYHRYSVFSLGMAYLKCELPYHYPSYRRLELAEALRQQQEDRSAREQRLRDLMQPGGSYARYLGPDGQWTRTVERACFERDCDPETLAAWKAKQEKARAAWLDEFAVLRARQQGSEIKEEPEFYDEQLGLL